MSNPNPILLDPRVSRLSYSSLLTLHACPRKFQLYKLETVDESIADPSEAVTFAFGHAVGTGMQSYLEQKDEDEILWDMFLAWDANLLMENEKQNKSFWSAMEAIEKFQYLKLTKDYTLATYNGKPAVELSFKIVFPDGFVYIGFIDAVLIHNFSGEVIVLENKTTSGNRVEPQMYKNSAQGTGYSTILDIIVPECSAYKVLYCVYKTKDQEYVPMPFPKNRKHRADFLLELSLDVEVIKFYATAGHFPMRGESCYNYFRPCEYFGKCDKPTVFFERKLSQKTLDKWKNETFDIVVEFTDLVAAQVALAEGSNEHEDSKLEEINLALENFGDELDPNGLEIIK